MGLMCSCGDWGFEPGMVIWENPNDYAPLATKRGRACCSCGEHIAVGDTCCEVTRWKVGECEYEWNRFGDEYGPPRASKYLCERGSDLYWSLDELGFCGQPWENQIELAKEYAEVYAKSAR